MNESDHIRFRRLIETRLEELQDDLTRGQDGTATVVLDQQAVGRLSRQDALINQAMSQAQQGRRATEIKRLRAALSRLDEGEFGFCEDCGDDIAIKRMELDPAATHCISCAAG